MLLQIRDIAKKLLDESGAVRMEKLFVSGKAWDSMACVDLLVERGELQEITSGMDVAGQHRVYVNGKAWHS